MNAIGSLPRRVAYALRLGNWELDESNRIRRGSWLQTYSGVRVWPLDPRADEIHFDDVCVGLARECRYGNHAREFYSVGEHSVLVSQFCERLALERGWSRASARWVAGIGLLHDASEAYLGDIPRPLKRQRAMRGYRKLEAKWWTQICRRFDLFPTESAMALVHEVDNRLLLDEIDALLLDPDMWRRAGRYRGMQPLGAEIAALPWEQAAEVFAQRFDECFPEWIKTPEEYTALNEDAFDAFSTDVRGPADVKATHVEFFVKGQS